MLGRESRPRSSTDRCARILEPPTRESEVSDTMPALAALRPSARVKLDFERRPLKGRILDDELIPPSDSQVLGKD